MFDDMDEAYESHRDFLMEVRKNCEHLNDDNTCKENVNSRCYFEMNCKKFKEKKHEDTKI